MSPPVPVPKSANVSVTEVIAELRSTSGVQEEAPWRSARPGTRETIKDTSEIPNFMRRGLKMNRPLTASESTDWDPSDVGYFLPDNTCYDHHYCDGGILYFSNVLAFIQHLRGVAVHKPEYIIRNNIQTCFRGKALDWYDRELTNDESDSLTCLPLEKGWYRLLIERFRPHSDVAHDKYREGEYTVDDAWAGHDPVEWAHTMMRDAEASGITQTALQLRHIWSGLDRKLMWPVRCPEHDTSVSDFMKELDDAYQEWYYYQEE